MEKAIPTQTHIPMVSAMSIPIWGGKQHRELELSLKSQLVQAINMRRGPSRCEKSSTLMCSGSSNSMIAVSCVSHIKSSRLSRCTGCKSLIMSKNKWHILLAQLFWGPMYLSISARLLNSKWTVFDPPTINVCPNNFLAAKWAASPFT